MVEGWGTVRTASGRVTVTDDSLRIRRAPRTFLRGQLSQVRTGTVGQRIAAVAGLAGLLLAPFLLALSLAPLGGSPGPLAVLGVAVLAAASLVQFWAKYARATEIPLSAIEDVSLRRDARTLTVTHRREGRLAVLGGDGGQRWFAPDDPMSAFEAGPSETTLTLLTDDDVREIRSVLQTRGIPTEEVSDAAETETTYRVDTKGGVVFCRDCGSQVSPSDRVCPACGAPLRVERSAESDSESREAVYET